MVSVNVWLLMESPDFKSGLLILMIYIITIS